MKILLLRNRGLAVMPHPGRVQIVLRTEELSSLYEAEFRVPGDKVPELQPGLTRTEITMWRENPHCVAPLKDQVLRVAELGAGTLHHVLAECGTALES